MTIQRELVRLVAATVLPAGIAAELLIAYSYERQRTIIEQRTLETARALMQAVDRELAGGRAALQALARSHHLATGDLAAFHRQAGEVIADMPGDLFALADSSGQIIVKHGAAIRRCAPEAAPQPFANPPAT